MNSKLNNIAVKINTLRTQQGMTYQNLADKTDMTKSTLQRYENGHIANIPLHKMEILAKALNVTPAYLMGWEEHPNILINKDINELTEIHNQLNSKGQDKLIDYGKDLLINPAYIKKKSSN